MVIAADAQRRGSIVLIGSPPRAALHFTVTVRWRLVPTVWTVLLFDEHRYLKSARRYT